MDGNRNSDQRDTDNGMTLLTIHPGYEEAVVCCDLTSAPIDANTSYDVLAIMPEDEDRNATIKLDGRDFSLPTEIESALRRFRWPLERRTIYIEHEFFQVDGRLERGGHAQHLRLIHTSAQEVMIWIGDVCKEDFMDEYLGTSTLQTVVHAFDFARMLAQAKPSDVGAILQNKFPETGLQSWFYLIRILYRPWFRGLRLLRTNYLDGLPVLTVYCGLVSIRWSDLDTAAQRLRVAKPLSRYLLEADVSTDRVEVLEADHQWVTAGMRFGFDVASLCAQVMWLLDSVGEKSAHYRRFQAHMGYSEDIYRKPNVEDLKPNYRALEAGNGDPAIDTTKLEDPEPVASLPFEGFLRPVPAIQDRASFVHLPMREHEAFPLLLLLPHNGEPASIVQCGMIECSPEEPPPFAYVLNATFCQPRTSELIFINGQSFRVSKILEIFLRCVRDADFGQFFFIWPVCMPSNVAQVPIDDWSAREMYTYFKHQLVSFAAETVDMYDVLDSAGETFCEEIPQGMTWDDWLVELND